MTATPARDDMLDFALAAFKDSPNPVVSAHANKLADAFEAEVRAVVPSAPAARAALRDRIAETIAVADGWEWPSGLNLGSMSAHTVDHYQGLADAVLAVLPAPADRPAILREAADAVRDGDLGPRGGMSRDYENGWWNSRAAAEDRVRRMADETQQEGADRGDPQETSPTADQQVRGVQAWMALDLHQALGWPVANSAAFEHQGRKSWGDWWAELLAGVRNVQMIRRYRGELLEPTAAQQTGAETGPSRMADEARPGNEWDTPDARPGTTDYTLAHRHQAHVGEAQQPETQADDDVFELPGPEVVAYRNADRPGVLLCREHGDGWWGLTPLTSGDLPDGGTCTYGDPADPDDVCGRDVLIAEARQADTAGEQQ